MTSGAVGWMVQGILCSGDSMLAGGAGEGDTIVCKHCGMNGYPSHSGPYCWRQEFSWWS